MEIEGKVYIQFVDLMKCQMLPYLNLGNGNRKQRRRWEVIWVSRLSGSKLRLFEGVTNERTSFFCTTCILPGGADMTTAADILQSYVSYCLCV